MSFRICQKNIITLILVIVCSTSPLFGQLKNFGTKAKFKPEPNYYFSIYGYADLWRETGGGFQYQLFSKYNLDVSAYTIRPNTSFKYRIKQWDYYDLKGYGISFKPKYQYSTNGNWCVGPNILFEWLSHGKTWVSYKDYNIDGGELKYLEETKGTAYTIGITFGKKTAINRFYFEPFIGIGWTEYKGKQTRYEADYRNPYSSVILPITRIYKQSFLQLNIGLKLGISFKKNKKHIAIDKKFDEVYIPKATQLMGYFKTIDPKTIEASKNLRMAHYRTKKLNRSILLRFKNSYSDTAGFYRKVDTLFQKIDLLIIKANH